MQYKIPQDVQVEDKIVGPLTLKQLIILGVGGGISYGLYNYFGSRYYMGIWVLIPLSIALVTLLTALLKVNGIPFGKWVLLLVEYFVNPRKRSFVMGSGDNYNATVFAEKPKKVQTSTESDAKTLLDRERLQKIGEISKMLDSYGKPQTQ